MKFKHAILLLVLAALAGACGGNKYNAQKGLLGVVKLGPFPKAPENVAGYSLYFSEKAEGPFKRLNTEVVAPFTSLMVPYLNVGQDYYFRMSMITKAPRREGPQGRVFKRTAGSFK